MAARPAPRPTVQVLSVTALVCSFISLITSFIVLLSGRPGSSRAVANFESFTLRYCFDDFIGNVEGYLNQELHGIEGGDRFEIETVGLSRSFSYDWHMYYLGACRSDSTSKARKGYLCHSRNPEEEVSVFMLALNWENDNSSLEESDTTFPSRYLDVEIIPRSTIGNDVPDEIENTEDEGETSSAETPTSTETEALESPDVSVEAEQSDEGEGSGEYEQHSKAKRQEDNDVSSEISYRVRELTDQLNDDLEAWANQDLQSTRGPFIALCIAIGCVFFQPVILIYLAAKPRRVSKTILAPLSTLIFITAICYSFTAVVITSRITTRVGDHDPFGGRVPGASIQITQSPSFLALTWIPAVMCLICFILIVSLDTIWTRDQRAMRRSQDSEKDHLLVEPES